MICGSSFCSNEVDPSTGCACLACNNRHYCGPACKWRDEKTHLKFCGREEDPNSLVTDLRTLKGYDFLHKPTLLSYALVQLGILKANRPSVPITINEWASICTDKYLSVTLRPVRDNSCPRDWNNIRFFTAEMLPFRQHPQIDRLVSAQVHLQNKFPAFSISYRIIPGSAAFFPCDTVEHFFYHSVAKAVYPPNLAENDEEFTIQRLQELMALEELSIRSRSSQSRPISIPSGIQN